MFDNSPHGGLYENLLSRWRSLRGIDRWPTVTAKVLSEELITGNEGHDYYKFTLSYELENAHNSFGVNIVRLSDTDNYYSYVQAGDAIPLLAHPTEPNKAVFADPSVHSAGGIFLFLFLLTLLLLGLLRSCS